MKSPNVEVSIFDTTLRDGAQALPQDHQFPPGSKPEIADMIAQMGVRVIEAGMPITAGDAEEVAEVARTVGQRSYDVTRWSSAGEAEEVQITPSIAGLSRAIEADIDRTWEAVSAARQPRIHVFVPTSNAHIKAKFAGKSVFDVQDMGIRALHYAREITDEHTGATIEFSTEDAPSTRPEHLERIVRLAAAQGADVINVPDTRGAANPIAMFHLYSWVINWALAENPEITVSAHNHNDKDQSVANTGMLVAAARAHVFRNGIPVNIQLETTICGVGERAGNANVFPVVADLFSDSAETSPWTPGDEHTAVTRWYFNPGRAVMTAQSIMGRAAYKVPPQSPIVGSGTNTHRSGIHSDGIIKGDHRIYTSFDPTFWGHEQDAVHEDGRYQGRAGRAAVAAVTVQ